MKCQKRLQLTCCKMQKKKKSKRLLNYFLNTSGNILTAKIWQLCRIKSYEFLLPIMNHVRSKIQWNKSSPCEREVSVNLKKPKGKKKQKPWFLTYGTRSVLTASWLTSRTHFKKCFVCLNIRMPEQILDQRLFCSIVGDDNVFNVKDNRAFFRVERDWLQLKAASESAI